VIDHELTRVAVGVELIVASCSYTFFALVICWNIIKHVSRAINIGSVIQSVTRLSYSDNLRAVVINRVFASECNDEIWEKESWEASVDSGAIRGWV